MKKIGVLFLSLSFSLISSATADSCQQRGLYEDHDKAVVLIEKAQEVIAREPKGQLVRYALEKYFKITERNSSLSADVFELLDWVAKNAKNTTYKCPQSKTPYCMGEHLAMVPPPKRVVQVCPNYFKQSRPTRVGTVIHEWMHRWGGRWVDYLPESYCSQSSQLPAEKLIRQSDNYMMFVYYLGHEGRQRLFCGSTYNAPL